MKDDYLRQVWERLKIGYRLPLGPVALSARFSRSPPSSGPSTVPFDSPRWERQSAAAARGDRRAVRAERGTCLIVGAGSNLGSALAMAFGEAGYSVAAARRHSDLLSSMISDLQSVGCRAIGIRCDATEPSSVASLFRRTVEILGVPDCVIFNVEEFSPGGVADITPAAFEHCWRVNCYGGFLVAREAARLMKERGHGTIIFSGATASTRGKEGYINLAVGKSGLRALAQSLARELGPAGIHVCHVVLDGGMSGMGARDVATNYQHLHEQPSNAWTHELDLRRHDESW